MNIVKREKSLETYNTMPVSKAVIQNILPAIVSMLMVLIYNLADTFFIGKTGDAYQVAAVSLATPVFLLFMAVGTVFGIGGTSVISRAIGRGEKDYAKSVCAFCMWSCVFIGLVLSVLFLIFMDPLLRIIGASKNTWAHTKTYLTIVGAGGVCSVISSCFSNVLRAEGKAAAAMTGQILGNALNIILDPLFILGFSWDIAGAAWATVIGQAAAAVYYIFCYTGGKSELGIHIRDVRIKNGICAGVLAIGVPAALGSLLMSLSQNYYEQSYGGARRFGAGGNRRRDENHYDYRYDMYGRRTGRSAAFRLLRRRKGRQTLQRDNALFAVCLRNAGGGYDCTLLSFYKRDCRSFPYEFDGAGIRGDLFKNLIIHKRFFRYFLCFT